MLVKIFSFISSWDRVVITRLWGTLMIKARLWSSARIFVAPLACARSTESVSRSRRAGVQHVDLTGHAGRVPDAGYRPAGGAAGGPPAGAGRGAGPRQRGHRLAHRRRLRGGGAVPAARLRRALCPQDGARHHGGLLPPAGVGGEAGGPAGWPGRPSPCMPPPCGTTRRTSAPSRWRAPPWSSAARGGGCPSRCWTPAGRL